MLQANLGNLVSYVDTICRHNVCWYDYGSVALLWHFQKCDFWKCKSQNSKNWKPAQKCQDDPKKSFPRRSENHTFVKKT